MRFGLGADEELRFMFKRRSKLRSENTLVIIECSNCRVDKILCKFPTSAIIMTRDFNQPWDTDLTKRTGLMQTVDQRTRGARTLDRILVSSRMYTRIKVVTLTARSDHLAIIASCGGLLADCSTTAPTHS